MRVILAILSDTHYQNRHYTLTQYLHTHINKAARRMLAGLYVLLVSLISFLTIRQTLARPRSGNLAKVYDRFGTRLNLEKFTQIAHPIPKFYRRVKRSEI